jgi:phage terminase small subunit
MKTNQTKPPSGLSAPMRRWWAAIVGLYQFDPQHYELLRLACQSWDTAAQAQRVIDREGLTYIDRFEQPKARPEVGIARDARLSFARFTRELGLDLTDVESRPPRIGNQKF